MFVSRHKSCYAQSRPICRYPLTQDPRQRVPAGSSRVPAFARPGSLDITASCVHRLGELSRGSRTDQQKDVGLTAEPCANSPPHPSRQRACHCALFRNWAGSLEAGVFCRKLIRHDAFRAYLGDDHRAFISRHLLTIQTDVRIPRTRGSHSPTATSTDGVCHSLRSQVRSETTDGKREF